jgi:hypothetical protein
VFDVGYLFFLQDITKRPLTRVQNALH